MNEGSRVQVLRGDLPGGLAAAFESAPRLAWDVETTGLDWRQQSLATCQLFAERVGVVIVAIEAGRPPRLARLLEHPKLVKVFHHAPFDLRFMVHAWGIQPASIRCTKVASKLLDPHAPNEVHSLQRLVADHLGITVDKGPVRTSDWTSHSLSPEQIEYAAGDVIHLLALHDALEAALQQVRRTQLYDECCAFLPARVALELAGYPDVFAY